MFLSQEMRQAIANGKFKDLSKTHRAFYVNYESFSAQLTFLLNGLYCLRHFLRRNLHRFSCRSRFNRRNGIGSWIALFSGQIRNPRSVLFCRLAIGIHRSIFNQLVILMSYWCHQSRPSGQTCRS